MIVMTNTTGADIVDAPTRGDGEVYRYELLFAGESRRAYADSAADLMAVLIPGYGEMGDDGQWKARLEYAANAQVTVQAHVNMGEAFHRCTTQQREILAGTRHEPPVVADWDCPVPLVLVASYYMPAGGVPRPQPVAGMPPNVLWIDPSDELSLLTSLNDVGYVVLSEAVRN